MKIALISDIHGNLDALNAVLEDINRQDISKIICLGDIATLGPQPLEVIRSIKSLQCPCIMGNHEMALLHPDDEPNYEIPGQLSSTLQWCREQLNSEDLSFLNTFEEHKSIALNDTKKILCYHGSPESCVENIWPETPDEHLKQIFDNYTGHLMAGGHTHIQMVREYNNCLLINPGSVGCPFVAIPAKGETPRLLSTAMYAVIQIYGEAVNVDLRQIPFDVRRFTDTLMQSDLPTKKWWLEQYV